MAFRNSLLAVVFLTMSSCSAWAAEQGHSLDFVYVSPNTGHAAGGHYGLKLGNYLYHYQFFANGEFLLVRESWPKFTLIYAELSNRPIHIAAVPVAPETFDRVAQQFAQTLIRQNLDLQQREELAAARQFIENLKRGQENFALPGAGMLSMSVPSSANGLANSLQQRLISDLGDGILNKAIENIDERIARHEHQPLTAQWSLELQNLLQKRSALVAIDLQFGLNPKAVVAPLPGESPLGEETLAALGRYRQTVYHSIVRLISSDRAGDGAALLLQLARYQVLTLSLEEEKLHSLDPFPDDALRITLSKQILGSNALHNLYRAQSLDQQNLLGQLQTTPHPELVMNRMEEVRGRMSELDKVFDGAKQIRYERGKMVPEMAGMIMYRPQRMLPAKALDQAEKNISSELERVERRILASHNYNLLNRNCVTEMNLQLNSAFGSRKEGELQLGGWISPGEQFSFSPFMFHRLVAKKYSVDDRQEIPSRRLRQLEEQQLDSLVDWLRESNAVTSSLYSRRERDTAFLMFTDSNWALRPLFGLINAGYGAVYTLTGVATLPFDKGERLEQGALGVFYSLPELVYINIRKGTYLAPDYSFLEESP